MDLIEKELSENLKNITFMFTADEYVSGGATIYRAEIEEVLSVSSSDICFGVLFVGITPASVETGIFSYP
jgi:hypothetical protein